MAKHGRHRMISIPDPGFTLTRLLRIERDEDAADNALGLFWETHNRSMDHDVLIERLSFFERMDSKGGAGGWTEPVVHHAMLKGFKDPVALVDFLLQKLDDVERSKRVPYEPDSEAPWERHLVSLHVSAARAWVLKSRDGYSEDVRDLLKESWRSAQRLTGTWTADSSDPASIVAANADPEYKVSVVAVAGLTLLELFKQSVIDGGHADALHFVGLSSLYLAEVVRYRQHGVSLGRIPWGANAYSLLSSPTLPPTLQELSAQDVVDVFERLRDASRGVAWEQVARDCEILNYSWVDAGRAADESVLDRDGDEWEWASYWNHACGWAKAQLHPSEVRGLLAEEHDRRAERRLRTYFFPGDLWEYLPERARRSLVDADSVLFAGAAGRIEAAFNHLRIALEEVLHDSLWVPLELWAEEEPTSAKDFRGLRERLARNNRHPSLPHFEEMCRTKAMMRFLHSRGTADSAIRFVTQEVAGAIMGLRRIRAEAEHRIGPTGQVDDIEEWMRKMLGLGTEGMLLRLIDLRRDRARRLDT